MKKITKMLIFALLPMMVLLLVGCDMLGGSTTASPNGSDNPTTQGATLKPTTTVTYATGNSKAAIETNIGVYLGVDGLISLPEGTYETESYGSSLSNEYDIYITETTVSYATYFETLKTALLAAGYTEEIDKDESTFYLKKGDIIFSVALDDETEEETISYILEVYVMDIASNLALYKAVKGTVSEVEAAISEGLGLTFSFGGSINNVYSVYDESSLMYFGYEFYCDLNGKVTNAGFDALVEMFKGLFTDEKVSEKTIETSMLMTVTSILISSESAGVELSITQQDEYFFRFEIKKDLPVAWPTKVLNEYYDEYDIPAYEGNMTYISISDYSAPETATLYVQGAITEEEITAYGSKLVAAGFTEVSKDEEYYKDGESKRLVIKYYSYSGYLNFNYSLENKPVTSTSWPQAGIKAVLGLEIPAIANGTEYIFQDTSSEYGTEVLVIANGSTRSDMEAWTTLLEAAGIVYSEDKYCYIKELSTLKRLVIETSSIDDGYEIRCSIEEAPEIPLTLPTNIKLAGSYYTIVKIGEDYLISSSNDSYFYKKNAEGYVKYTKYGSDSVWEDYTRQLSIFEFHTDTSYYFNQFTAELPDDSYTFTDTGRDEEANGVECDIKKVEFTYNSIAYTVNCWFEQVTGACMKEEVGYGGYTETRSITKSIDTTIAAFEAGSIPVIE